MRRLDGTRFRRFFSIAGLAAAGIIASAQAHAALVPIGDVVFDVGTSTTATIDILNFTGANSFAPFFPVTTTVTLSGLSLVVNFSDGSSHTFTQSDFTLSADGQSYDGPTVALGGTAVPTKATLNGTLTPTTIDAGSGPETVDADFVTAIITDALGSLQDGDFAEIDATTGGGTTTVPEPSGLLLLGTGLFGFALFRRRPDIGSLKRLFTVARYAAAASIAACAMMVGSQAASAAVTLAAAASPSTGVAGVNAVNVIASGIPGGTLPASVTIRMATTCPLGGSVSGEIDTTASKITALGGLQRVQFVIPAGAAQQTYLVSISGPGFVSTDCSILVVTHTNAVLAACLPTSSLAVALGTHVVAYAPNGYWEGGSTGVQAVPLEGGGSPTSIATPNIVNSCSSNPATGETVCTANNTDVYLINGTTLTTTLTSSLTGFAGFSGGSCENCGVAVNALTNFAYINGGLPGSPSGDGIQGLNLGTNTFSTPFGASTIVSENISIDPGRNLILSPNEADIYDLFQLSPAGAILTEFENTAIPNGFGEFDSAAEDCTTGIALSADEFTSNIVLADLSQATFTPGSPGTWSAPNTLLNLNNENFSAGTSGISVAPGGSHLGIVTGEFGGQAFDVFLLPSTAGTGGAAPNIVDHAYVASLPSTPDGGFFSAGFDPHTITAYTSPNDGKSYGVIADFGFSPSAPAPAWLAVIDLQKILSAPRVAGTNNVDLTAFDLLASGALRYVATH